MPSLITVLSTAAIPFASFTSLSIFLALHPDSPITHLVSRPVKLPIHRDEALDGTLDHDPFDLYDPVISKDGYPVDAEKFWRKAWRQKIAFIFLLLPAFGLNIFRLVLAATSHLEGDEFTKALLLPVLLLSSHLVTLLISFWYLRHTEMHAHWNTTIHLAINVFAQFIVTATLSLVPAEPFPKACSDFVDLALASIPLPRLPHTAAQWSRLLLPLAHIPPLVMILSIRRGPPLYFPLDAIYPPRIVEAIPADAPGADPTQPNLNEETQATIPEWLLFSYATNVIKKGSVRDTMDVWDLPVLQSRFRAMLQYMNIRKIYGQQRKRLGRMEGFNLLIKIVKANRKHFIIQTILIAIGSLGYYLPHYVLKIFLDYLQNDPSRSIASWGWLLAFSLFITNAAVSVIYGITWSIGTTTLQAGIRLQLNTLLFAKTLAKKDIAAAAEMKKQMEEKDSKDRNGPDTSDKEKAKDGEEDDDEGVSSKTQIMTLFTVDVDRVTDFVWHEFALIDAPLEMIVATVFLLNLLGTSALFGLLAALICMPLNHLAAKVVVTAQENLMKARDQRTALMNEILQGIRMLKFMAWERSFEKRINGIRQEELHWQARNYMIEVGFNCVWALTPVLVTVVSFLHFTLVAKRELTPSIAFTSVAVFAELRYALNALPETFIEALQGFVSCRRIEKYMSSAEIPRPEPFDQTGNIVLNNATFAWPRDDSGDNIDGSKSSAPTPKSAFTLADMTLAFPRGELSLICGRLGSGKSLLLNGLLGEADLVTGQMSCPRSSPDLMASFGTAKINPADWIIPEMIAYVPQQAWLQNASIKDNIIFSSPWDEERYKLVLDACSLLTDLEILEDGDETEIGEKGLNLSGGQKARVSLARAVYSRAGVLLLDDVLSAVDAHTAHALMENCIQGPMLAERTVLLVSHHTTLVSPAAAYIVALENGNVKFSGTRSDFVDCGLMNELDTEEKQKLTEAEQKEEATVEQRAAEPSSRKAVNKSLISISGEEAGGSGASTPGTSSETSSIAPDDEDTLQDSEQLDSTKKKEGKTPRKLIEDEQRAKGRIAWPVWKTYFGALGGTFWWILFVVSLVMAMLVPVAENGWLERWTGSGSRKAEEAHSSTYYVLGYCIITLIGVFASNVQYAVIYFGSLKASKKLHNAMLNTVLFATLRFHDTTSRGRLLNRFGKDIEGLDSSMADNFLRSLAYGLNVVVTFISITYVGGPPFIAAGVVMLALYYKAGSIYGQASRDMRRLDSVTRSPLYSLFGETVSGVAVIRAFGASTIALKQMMRLSDTNLLAFYWSWTVNRWLSARFNFLSAVILGLTAVVILITPSVTASMAGFALAFATTISHNLLFVVRRFVQLEQSMVALERIKEYSELKQEAAEIIEPRPPAAWPESGAITVEDLVIRYAPDLPNVLHGISFSVSPRQKIGIVGSTGCGKSTLALSFFRFVEATGGRITIDGIDISKIGLTDLRTRVTIIPQDPTILSGTLRSTLDVFDEYDDADIYAALKRVHLLKEGDLIAQPVVEGEEERNANVFKDLNNPVSEGGDNFSSGEKQLMCMARAILRRNRVLFMDEATASIDYETDELISKTIREEFSDSTILTIAHRIHTIIDFDKVLVMDRGRLAEFASPAELLRDPKSRFYGLCKATGRTEFKNLKTMAAEAERKRKELA